MVSTITHESTSRETCLAFAERFRGPGVAKAIAAAEAGQVTWEQVEALFGRSYQAGRAAVSE